MTVKFHTASYKDITKYPPKVIYFQTMNVICPKCHQSVQFITSPDDGSYQEAAEFWEDKYEREHVEKVRIQECLDQILKNYKGAK